MAAPIPTSAQHCRVIYADRTVITARWHCPLAAPFWRLYLNDAPGSEIVYPGGVHPLVSERVHVVPAWGDFTGRCRGDVGHVYLHLDPGEPLRGLARLIPRPLVLPPDPAAHRRLRELVAAPGRSSLWQMRAQAAALAALVACVELLPRTLRARLDEGAVGDDAIARALVHIEGYLHEELPIPLLARRCGLSTPHFGVRFKRRTGQTPQRYLQERRVAVAAERLLSGDESIEAIASGCGFANRYHFSRVFARRMGIGPGAYRRGGRF
jgi:AraC-like DNA-binding protein